MIDQPMPFIDALLFLLNKEQLPADWDSAMWAKQEPDFAAKAFLVSRVENARFLDKSQGFIFDYMAQVTEEVTGPDGVKRIALKVDGRERFVLLMRDFMIQEGMASPEEFRNMNQKDVRQLGSLARLRLIFDTNVRQAYGFGQWKQGMTPAALKKYPAARLIRDKGVKEPRPRHQDNLGEVLLKTDPRWAEYHNAREIGGFGVSWGPYGFHSGVTQEPVRRKEAVKLKLVSPEEETTSPENGARIIDGFEASTRKLDPVLKQKLLDELAERKAARAARRAAGYTIVDDGDVIRLE